MQALRANLFLWKTQMPNANAAHYTPASPLVALAHETLKHDGPFDSIADLAEALKCKAARLHLRYDATLISSALLAVERTRPLPMIQGILQPTLKQLVEKPDTIKPLSQAHAVAILTELHKRAKIDKQRTMPKPKPLSDADIELFKRDNNLWTPGAHRPTHVAPLPTAHDDHAD